MTTTTVWDFDEKIGTFEGGWAYNEHNLTYNQAIDPDGGGIVYYNGIGTGTTTSKIQQLQTK